MPNLSGPPPLPDMSSHALHVRRWRIAIVLTAAVAIIYFGFILLIAYQKETMGRLLAPGLSLGILLGYEYLLKQMGWGPTPEQIENKQPPAAMTSKAPVSSPTPEKDQLQKSGAANTRPADSHATAPWGEQTIEVATDLYRVTLSNRGGVITSWELLRYRLAPDTSSPPVQLMYKEGKFARPLALHLDDAALTQRVNGGLYEIERDFDRLDAAQKQEVLVGLRDGKITFASGLPARTFFGTLYQNVMEGMFADPIYGGNKNKVGWRMIGFPGVVAVHGQNIVKFRDKKFVAEPKSIADLS